MTPEQVRLSKLLSLWLRHKPAAGGLQLDPQGWTQVEAVLAAFGRNGIACNREALLAIVAESDKQRFALSDDAVRIRAQQGHSIAVDLQWPRASPPELLYHGTVDRFLDAILADGLKPMRRHHVHLSLDIETAWKVGARRGTPVILTVRAAALEGDGQAFFLTDNQVWLTERVPAAYIDRP